MRLPAMPFWQTRLAFHCLYRASKLPVKPPSKQTASASTAADEPSDAWSANFARALQVQHVRVREFLRPSANVGGKSPGIYPSD